MNLVWAAGHDVSFRARGSHRGHDLDVLLPAMAVPLESTDVRRLSIATYDLFSDQIESSRLGG
jgi:hypothetical protein